MHLSVLPLVPLPSAPGDATRENALEEGRGPLTAVVYRAGLMAGSCLCSRVSRKEHLPVHLVSRLVLSSDQLFHTDSDYFPLQGGAPNRETQI